MTTKARTYFLEDIPATQRRWHIDAIKPDTIVKVLFVPTEEPVIPESMWLRVTEVISEGVYRGTLENKPLGDYADHGDAIDFTVDNVMATKG